ncbi:hypothetical protein [Moorena sp. SIO3I6]|uniref:hypothetical protein n=1 Tax=Moorena sp. SIO3I6 TaxID=2607831 RepID=UPI0013F85F8E|nr:transposase [Moorena sp. SIO3I6]
MPLLKNYKVCLLGDREFCSLKLAQHLQSLGVYFCLRLKKNEFIEVKNYLWIQLNNLGLTPGLSLFIQGVKAMQRGLGEAARSWGSPPETKP